jgi:uncharacterized Zn-finger protein
MLLSHNEAVHSNANLACPECDFKAKSESKLLLHISAFHNLKEGLICKECSRGFKRKKELKRHLDSVHNHKKFECEVCGQRFTRKDSVNRHARIHLNIRPNAQTRLSSIEVETSQDLEIADDEQSNQAFNALLEVVKEMPRNVKKMSA